MHEVVNDVALPDAVAWRFQTSARARWQYGDAPVPVSVYKHEPLYTKEQLLEYGEDQYAVGFERAYG